MKKIITVTLAAMLGTAAYAIPQGNVNAIDYTKAANKTLTARNMEHPPKATSTINLRVNLNASDEVMVYPFSPSDPSTFHLESNSIIYDSLGASHVLSVYFTKINLNEWVVQVIVDGQLEEMRYGYAFFDGKGQLIGTNDLKNLAFSTTNGSLSPQSYAIILDKSTQYASPSKVKSVSQDGYPHEPDYPNFSH